MKQLSLIFKRLPKLKFYRTSKDKISQLEDVLFCCNKIINTNGNTYAVGLKKYKIIDVCKNISGEKLLIIYRSITKRPQLCIRDQTKGFLNYFF